ncbi:hypothetical protein MRX96_037773 [Rhipicephalus microplus]
MDQDYIEYRKASRNHADTFIYSVSKKADTVIQASVPSSTGSLSSSPRYHQCRHKAAEKKIRETSDLYRVPSEMD